MIVLFESDEAKVKRFFDDAQPYDVAMFNGYPMFLVDDYLMPPTDGVTAVSITGGALAIGTHASMLMKVGVGKDKREFKIVICPAMASLDKKYNEFMNYIINLSAENMVPFQKKVRIFFVTRTMFSLMQNLKEQGTLGDDMMVKGAELGGCSMTFMDIDVKFMHRLIRGVSEFLKGNVKDHMGHECIFCQQLVKEARSYGGKSPV